MKSVTVVRGVRSVCIVEIVRIVWDVENEGTAAIHQQSSLL
jgi:hypothetical protein